MTGQDESKSSIDESSVLSLTVYDTDLALDTLALDAEESAEDDEVKLDLMADRAVSRLSCVISVYPSPALGREEALMADTDTLSAE